MEWVLAVVLLGAVVTDLSSRRIPNWLTFSAAAAGLGWHAWSGGIAGAGLALSGLAVGLACFLPSYLFGAMGGGDVKLMAATGSFLGPMDVVIAAAAAVGAGGALALAHIARRGGLNAMAARYGAMFLMLAATRRFSYLGPAKGEPAGERFPYAIAIAVGTLVAMVWWH